MKVAGTAAQAWPALAGLVSLAAAAVFALLLVPRWQHDADAGLLALRQAREARQWQEASVAGQRAAAATVPAWPQAAASPRRAAALSAQARSQGLELLQVREQLDPSSFLQVGMNGRASYPALRQFVERALARDTALVLDRLRLHRSEADATVVDFELQWTLLHLTSSGGAPAGADLRSGVRPDMRPDTRASIGTDAGPRP